MTPGRARIATPAPHPVHIRPRCSRPNPLPTTTRAPWTPSSRSAPDQALQEGDIPAVDDISFDVGPGELFAFLGPNGAGKTTTISILTTTLAKTSGTVTIAGHDLDREATAVRRNIGIIFQNPSIDLHLSGEENIRLHVAIYGLYGYRPLYRVMPAEYRERVEHLAGIVGLADDLGKPLKTFSGGMKRKLEIIRSLMHRPAVLFLDEPTSGLDPVSRRGLWEYLREVRNADGTTIFLTTHYLEEAEEADRVCVIDHGRIAVIGTPDEMKRELLDRSVVLDAADRAGARRRADAGWACARWRPDGSCASPTRHDRPGAHRPDPHAVDGPAGPRAEPGGGLRGAPAPARGGRRMTTDIAASPRRSAIPANRGAAWPARRTRSSRSPGARSCAR